MIAIEVNATLLIKETEMYSVIITGPNISKPKKEYSNFKIENINKDCLVGARMMIGVSQENPSMTGINSFVSSILQHGFRGDIVVNGLEETKNTYLQMAKVNLKLSSLVPGLYDAKYGYMLSAAIVNKQFGSDVLDFYCDYKQMQELKKNASLIIYAEEKFVKSPSETIYRLTIGADAFENILLVSGSII